MELGLLIADLQYLRASGGGVSSLIPAPMLFPLTFSNTAVHVLFADRCFSYTRLMNSEDLCECSMVDAIT